jgi:polysaccharide biosynthesis protein PslH
MLISVNELDLFFYFTGKSPLMNILFLTKIAPFPPNGGEKLRSYGLLKLLSGLHYNIHAITANVPDNEKETGNFPGIRFHPYDFDKNKTKRRLLKWYRLFTREKELILLINDILQHNQIDIAYIDYYFYGQYIGYFKKLKIPVIYGTHNAQAMLLHQMPAVSFKNNISMFLEYWICRIHEAYYFRKADALIVVSDNDLKYHGAFIKKNRIFLIPNFLIETDYPASYAVKENYILMTANFKAYQNTYGLEWFIREIWDHELWSKTQLFLVGIGSLEFEAELRSKYDFENVTAFGEVADLKPFIVKARVCIVPLLHGSGTRLKCLEAMALKTQLVSTSKGAEGIEHHHSIMLADTPGDFKKALLQVIEMNTDRSEQAYQAFMDKYSLPPNRKIFETIVATLVDK